MENQFVKRNGYYYDPQTNIGYPSVTTVSRCVGDNSGLIRWAVEQGSHGVLAYLNTGGTLINNNHAKEVAIAAYEQELNRTGSFGSNVHTCLEAYLLTGKEDYPALGEKEQQAIGTYIAFLKNVGIAPTLVEAELLNTRQGYAGRLDLYGSITNPQAINAYCRRSSDVVQFGPCIIDFKTGSFDKRTHGLQLAAYAGALRENLHACDGGLILTVERENPKKVVAMYYNKETLDDYYRKFLVVLEAWKEMVAPNWWHDQFKSKVA